jgi:pilus assembly protein CpaE
LTFVVFSDQSEVGEILSTRLESSGRARVAEIVDEPEALQAAVKQNQASAVFIEFGRAPHLVLDALEAIPSPRPILIGAGPTDDPAILLRAMKLGMREYLSPDCAQDEISEALNGLLAEQGIEGPRAPGRVIAVMGTKGGVGATFVVTQLAATLQAGGQSTAIVDLNYPLGDVAVQLDLNPRHTLADLGDDHELDAVFLRSVMERHSSGCSVLAAPKRVEEAELQTGEQTERVLELLKQEFDWVIVDVSRSWNDPSARALAGADQILLVTLLEVTTLNHAKQHVDLLTRLGHQNGRVRLIANRFSKSDPVTEKDCEDFVGRPVEARIPNDYATSATCLSQGIPVLEIAPGSALNRAFQRLGRELQGWCGIECVEENPDASFTGRLRRLVRR